MRASDAERERAVELLRTHAVDGRLTLEEFAERRDAYRAREGREVVLAPFGNVDIHVPERVNVDVGGVTIFGHRREWGRDIAVRDAPTIRVRVWGWFGTVDVWRVPYDMRGDYGEIFDRLREQQRQLPA